MSKDTYGRNITGKNAVFFSLQPTTWHTIFVCIITDDVHIDELIKVVSASLLHCRATYTFPLGS